MNEVKDLNAMSDAEISEAFALEVAGWTYDAEVTIWYFGGDPEPEPTFATDANAVLPWIEKYAYRFEAGRAIGCQYGVSICGVGEDFTEWSENGWHRAVAATFPRAACCALIAARRAAKEATP